jgi:hypothetical protein
MFSSCILPPHKSPIYLASNALLAEEGVSLGISLLQSALRGTIKVSVLHILGSMAKSSHVQRASAASAASAASGHQSALPGPETGRKNCFVLEVAPAARWWEPCRSAGSQSWRTCYVVVVFWLFSLCRKLYHKRMGCGMDEKGQREP